MRLALITVVVAALFLTAIAATQHRVTQVAVRDDEERLLYLPNEKLLTHFTGGLSSVVADLLWLRAIQYTAEHFRGDFQFTWLEHMCQTAVRLDPYFVDVYRHGGMFLAALRADSDASLELLRLGAVNNPRHWELPYEMAMVYLLNRKDEPHAVATAGRYLALALQTGNAPTWVFDLAANIHAAHDLDELEQDMWIRLADGDDAFMREMAHQKLAELHIRRQLAVIDEAAAHYRRQTGRAPENIEGLVASGILTHKPDDPLGGRYFLDDAGQARNSTLMDLHARNLAVSLQGLVRIFRDQQGRWPHRLEELEEEGLIAQIYVHPYPDRAWRYDPVTGEVE